MRKWVAWSLGLVVIAISLVAAGNGRRGELDHMGAYNFMVEISGVSAGYFKGVDGLSAEIEVIEYQDGDDIILRKRPGRTKLTLRDGVAVGEKLEALVGQGPRTIRLPLVKRPDLQSLEHEKLCTFTLKDARVLGVERRKVKSGNAVFTVVDVNVQHGGEQHDCDRYFIHPSKRPPAK